MAKELRKLEFWFTTKDFGDLPAGMNADDVATEIEDVMKAAGAAWYRERGELLLAYEPEFAWRSEG